MTDVTSVRIDSFLSMWAKQRGINVSKLTNDCLKAMHSFEDRSEIDIFAIDKELEQLKTEKERINNRERELYTQKMVYEEKRREAEQQTLKEQDFVAEQLHEELVRSGPRT